MDRRAAWAALRPARPLSADRLHDRLARLLGTVSGWAPLDSFLADYLSQPELRASARASALSASLEMVREGEIDLRQNEPFAPIYLRRRSAAEHKQLKAADA